LEFREFGISKHELKCLKHLVHNNFAFTRDIEIQCNMRQPEVCVALKKLREKGWVNYTTAEENRKRGRPKYIFFLTKSPDEILKEIENAVKQKLEKLKQELNSI